MSSDKKNEDFVVRMPDNGFAGGEKDPFAARNTSHRHHAHVPDWKDSVSKIDNNPGVSIAAYCMASISMTVVNKYCVSGKDWNLNLLYLAIQVRSPPSHKFISCCCPNNCLLEHRVHSCYRHLQANRVD